jgi:hypothetical protein
MSTLSQVGHMQSFLGTKANNTSSQLQFSLRSWQVDFCIFYYHTDLRKLGKWHKFCFGVFPHQLGLGSGRISTQFLPSWVHLEHILCAAQFHSPQSISTWPETRSERVCHWLPKTERHKNTHRDCRQKSLVYILRFLGGLNCSWVGSQR